MDDKIEILVHPFDSEIYEGDQKFCEAISKKLDAKYPKLSHEVKIHIPVLLIARRVLENIYGKKVFRKELEKEEQLEVLDQAWPFVNRLYPKFTTNVIKFLE